MLGADNADIHLIDGFPMDVCVRTRAARSKIFKEEAAFGYCASKKKSFYGFQGHLLVAANGIPVFLGLTPANIDGSSDHKVTYWPTVKLSSEESRPSRDDILCKSGVRS